MKHATIVSGAYDNCWGSGESLVLDDGTINWGAAFRADPGCRKCPGCNAYFWNEAAVLECPDCGVQFGDGCKPSGGEAKP